MTRGDRRRRWQSVLDFIARENGLVTQARAARHAKVSVAWFRRVFPRQTGLNFRRTCLRIKLDYGALLLRTTTLDIPTISLRLGYSERGKFDQAFKRVFALTPTQYRREQHRHQGPQARTEVRNEHRCTSFGAGCE